MRVHRFWMGRPMPEAYQEYGEKWQTLNPDIIVTDWEESALLDFPEMAEVFEDLYTRDAGRHGVELSVQIADVMGYCLVARYGGIYVNCDMEPVRPLPHMPNQAWASYENMVDGRVNNAAIGAPEPYDPFWVALLNVLPENYWMHRLDEMVMATGPGFLTTFAEAYPHLEVLPMETFNSIHWSSVPLGGDAHDSVHWKDESELPPNVIARHHWGHRRDGRTNTVENATPPPLHD